MSSSRSGMEVAKAPSGGRLPLSAADLFAIAVSIPVVLGLGWSLANNQEVLASSWKPELAWLLAIALLNLLDIPNLYGLKLAPDVPLMAAVGVFFDPTMAAGIAFLGSWDQRELTGRIRPLTTVFNRSQVALSVFLGSVAAHAVGHLGPSLTILAAQALASLIVCLGANYLLVGFMSSLVEHAGPSRVASMMRLGRPLDFVATILAWGMMAFLLAAAYEVVSWWAVVAFCVPAVLGRQVLARSQQLLKSEAALEAKQEMVKQLSERVAFERREERVTISSQLHDDVLQPLFRVSLLCSVVHEDLANGMLLSLEEDVPALRMACDHASGVLRRFIKDLRTSPIGSRGLPETITALTRELQGRSQATLVTHIADVGDPPELVQLAAYQVLKEALLNAVHHAKAGRISVELGHDEEYIRFSVEDDGVGFDPALSKVGHFGLLIMRERSEAVGGVVYIDTAPGEGTVVAGRFPLAGAD
jgi:signal transduction histidine kinase